MIDFSQPWMVRVGLMVLWVVCALAVLWIGRRTLSGLSTWPRRVALLVRLLLIGVILLAIAEPQWRKEAKGVAVTLILDVSRSAESAGAAVSGVPIGVQQQVQAYLDEAAKTAKDADRVGLITVGREAYVQALPGPLRAPLDVKTIGTTEGTNLEAGTRLAMAVTPPDAAPRFLIWSDGNENEGELMNAARAAKAAGIPIDVRPVRFALSNEVIVERLMAPATARQGENITARVVLNATAPTAGRLTMMLNGEPIDLDPDAPGLGKVVRLDAGVNVETVPISVRSSGPQRFEAVYEPITNAAERAALQLRPLPAGAVDDQVSENNRSLAVTFVGGEGKVLVLTAPDKAGEADNLMRALTEARIRADLSTPATAFASLTDLATYECVVLVNTAQYDFTQQQQEELKAYVHDLGGGLLMVGGPDSFGAGGWIGSPLADALPIKLDPPQKRQMPRGALVLIMHACEMPDGNYWSKRTGEAAIDALSARDLAGVIEWGWQAGNSTWPYPLQEIGDKTGVKKAIKSMQMGDMMSFVPIMTDTLAALQKAQAGQKHCIIISDGDPQPPSNALLQQFVASKITISTVAVFPHSQGGELQQMRRIAFTTGGTYHEVTTMGQLNSLPQIFTKEAQTVRRSLIWEGDPFSPKVVGGVTDTLRGISAVPPITGYVVAGEREGLAQVTLRGQENDPVMAQWQYGLGRAVTFTSDATGRWAAGWVGSATFRPFWEQTIRWAMRPSGSPNIRVTTEEKGGQTRVVVEALDDQGERLNFVNWQGRIVRPDVTADDVVLRQTGPGRYEAVVESGQAGAYTMSLAYSQAGEGGSVKRGTVQAAITRPFADEFRALKDNSALLEQVARETGGRVLKGDPKEDVPWSREGLTMPVALTAIWDVVACIAVGLLLVDVAIRRVRIDLPMIASAVKTAFGVGKSAETQQMQSLRDAREKARQRMADAAAAAQGVSPGAAGFQPAPLLDPSAAAKGAKFEASTSELRAARGQSAVTPGSAVGAPIVEKRPPGIDQAKADGDGEAGMSRLLKAKRRAQDDMSDT
jgi:uncharacterized membrane protein